MNIIMAKQLISAYEDTYREKCRSRARGDNEKGKYMITFPYPYMNGKLHCGHYYSITKGEFTARQRDLEGYDVLFALGFHVTGTPIVSAANRVTEELNSGISGKQIQILHNMRVKDEDIINFKDPKHWGPYFIGKAKEDIAFAGICVDIDQRSFFTTEDNPYYDKFVRWQFKYLRDDGYLEFGKKHVIYSPKNKQPCADHDRSKGEGIIPQAVFCVKHKLEDGIYIIISTLYPEFAVDTKKCSKIGIVYKDSEFCFVSVPIDGSIERWIMSKTAACNIIHQFNGAKIESRFKWEDIEDKLDMNGHVYQLIEAKDAGQTGIYFMGRDSKSSLSRDGFMVSKDPKINKLRNELVQQFKDNNKENLIYYEPSGQVIGRSGDNCVVALVDQWFIDYSKTRDIVMEYAKEMETYSEVTKKKLCDAIDWLDMWPCSRSEGLGTKMPCDESVLIDSLSDSTIYWCLYTFYHLLSKYPISDVDNSLFDYVLRGDINHGYEVKPEVEAMRKEFLKWYPVDLRVSAKDLIGNHLPMALHNHYMIWKDKSMLPRAYYTNGYMLFNGEKMAKSEKFVTMEDIIKEYGIDASRIACALAGDTNDDASFETQNAIDAQKLLSDELEWIIEVLEIDAKDTGKTEDDYIWCKFFKNQMNADINDITKMFHNMSIREAYVKVRGMKSNKDMIRYMFKYHIDDQYMCKKIMVNYIKTFANCIYPFAPCWSHNVANLVKTHGYEFEFKWPNIGQIDSRLKCLENIYTSTIRKIRKSFNENDKTKNEFRYKVDVHIYNSFSTQTAFVHNKFKEQLTDIVDFNKIKKDIMISCTTKEQKQICGAFSREIEKNIDEYGFDWLYWCTEMMDEQYDLFNTWLMKILSEGKPSDTNGGIGEVNIIKHDLNDGDIYNGPMMPFVEVSSIFV